jgi:ribosome-associated protein
MPTSNRVKPSSTAAEDSQPSAPVVNKIENKYVGRISKTQAKKASHDLQDLGEAVVALPADRLKDLALDEGLMYAIEQFKKTKTHEGRRRQMQYIGKLMRRTDPEPMQEAVAAMNLGQAKDALTLHQAERWRAELLADDAALTTWMQDHPQTDLQQLRSLVRSARKDAAAVPEKRSGKAVRDLFKFIRAALQVPSEQPDEYDGV